MKKIILAALASLLAAAVQAGDLKLEVSVPHGRQGAVLAALFTTAQGFPRGAAAQVRKAEPVNGKATLEFLGLPPGDYAISAFLDENGNAQLDSNVFGIPTEPYGFSRNARAAMGPPAFVDAAFRVEGGEQRQTMELK